MAAELPLALVVSYWLLSSALMACLELLWVRAQRQPAEGGSVATPLVAQLRDMLTYGKVKETWSPWQNVPKAWFSHFYVVSHRPGVYLLALLEV
eukprot:COSAG02_NODE_1137_length_14313_cov_6.111369_6_plen_94_part_00